jgi:flagellar basal-body rod protein FlgB
MSMIDATQLLLEDAMRGASLRQTLLSNNIANAETPGYGREDVNFQAALRGAIGGGEAALAQIRFQPESQAPSAGPEGNGVNIDAESTQLAENGLDYQALTEVLGARDTIMRSAIGV